jgi:hypothetical protein
MLIGSLKERARQYDASRPGIPGEHWMALAGGVACWLATRRLPWLPARLAGSLIGTLLVVRATSGREVPKALAKLPYTRGVPRGGDWLG